MPVLLITLHVEISIYLSRQLLTFFNGCCSAGCALFITEQRRLLWHQFSNNCTPGILDWSLRRIGLPLASSDEIIARKQSATCLPVAEIGWRRPNVIFRCTSCSGEWRYTFTIRENSPPYIGYTWVIYCLLLISLRSLRKNCVVGFPMTLKCVTFRYS